MACAHSGLRTRRKNVDAKPRTADALDKRVVHTMTVPVYVCNWDFPACRGMSSLVAQARASAR